MNKKVILLGFNSPIRKKSKEYVLRKLYKKAKTNPFIVGKTFDEYMEFLSMQIKDFGDKEVDSKNVDDIYKSLEDMGWIKVVSAFILSVMSANTAIS
tara:strand:- start:10492 stop:10782 length:291 start_codon:yes stop_codon:yes gene_type:complete